MAADLLCYFYLLNLCMLQLNLTNISSSLFMRNIVLWYFFKQILFLQIFIQTLWLRTVTLTRLLWNPLFINCLLKLVVTLNCLHLYVNAFAHFPAFLETIQLKLDCCSINITKLNRVL